jgi:hypothetical protein
LPLPRCIDAGPAAARRPTPLQRTVGHRVSARPVPTVRQKVSAHHFPRRADGRRLRPHRTGGDDMYTTHALVRRGGCRGHDGAGLAAAATAGMVLCLWLFAGAVEAMVALLPVLVAAPIVP